MLDGMAEEFDRMGIARARIAEEAERRTGDLDLGRLGLTRLPPELFGLRHLRRLNLGDGIRIEREKEIKQVGGAAGSPNRIDGQLGSVGLLSGLEALSVSGTDLGGLEDLAGLSTTWAETKIQQENQAFVA